MKRLLTATAAAALIAAGCTSGESTTETAATVAATAEPAATTPEATAAPEATTAETAAPEATDTAVASTEATEPVVTEPAGPPDGLDGPAPGITDDTIKIGVTFIDLGSSNVSSNHGDYEGSYRAVVDDINAKGGINGRMIEPVFAPISMADGGNADAVCVQLTEDEQVFAVVGFFLGDAPACYLETHSTAIIGGTMTDDLLARAGAPWFSWDPSSDFNRDSVQLLVDAGELSGTIGVYGNADTEAEINDVFVPALQDLGVDVAEVAINDAPADDQVLQDAQAAAILQKFEDSGVDTIFAPGINSTPAFTALETSSYRPRVVGTNYGTALPFAQDPERDKSVLDGFVTTGVYGPPLAQMTEADFAACAEVIKAAGIDYYTIDQWEEGMAKPWVSAAAACTGMALFTAIATKAGPDLNYGTFGWAGENLGELKLPGNPEPYHYGPIPHTDGDAPLYLYRWDAAAGEITIDN